VCDRIDARFTGTDADTYCGSDARVIAGDARDAVTYPFCPFVVVTSPVYLNRISTDYLEGPTPNTKPHGRRSYGMSLGCALSPNNLARVCRSPERYYAEHGEAVRHWDHLAVVNVPEAMRAGWCDLLERHGYTIARVVEVATPGYGYGANVRKGARLEVVIVATRRPR
jgi:hypothetical protein